MLERTTLLSFLIVIAGFSNGVGGPLEMGQDVLVVTEESAPVGLAPAQMKDHVHISADKVATELAQLGEEYERLVEAQNRSEKESGDDSNDGAKLTDNSISDKEWLKRVRDIEAQSINPDVAVLPKMLDFAKRHPDSPYAFDALLFVIVRGGRQTGNVYGKPWKLKEEALDVVWASHSSDSRMSILAHQLAGSLPSKKTEAFLRRALEHSSDKQVRAAAAYSLAEYYSTFARVHHRSQQLKHKERLLNYERFWKVVITPYLEEEFPFIEEVNSTEIDRRLHLIRDKYADVPAINWRTFGPSHMFVELTPSAEPKTYGEMAVSMSFERNNIVPGKVAPEIDGTDANSKRFRLSNFQGKVVLLTFTANWCGPCITMHPLQRKLVEKYRNRPFVMLGVSRDEKIETLKAATTSGDITWRCWWDGRDGPINAAWNGTQGIPRFILLDDKQVIQPVTLNRFSTLEEFEEAIDALLINVSAGKSP